jgi:hypothetical protein
MKATSPLVRFEGKYIAVPESGCWLWLGSVSAFGHGWFWTGKVNDWAHRWSWRLFRGEIPEGMCVLHRCDVASCVNPAHLFLGTMAENVYDMVSKGRNRSGEHVTQCIHGHKYTEENTAMWRSGGGRVIKVCRICERARKRERYKLQRAA